MARCRSNTLCLLSDSARSLIRTLVRGTGQLMITAGLVILLFTVYELYGTGLAASRDQNELLGDLRDSWDQPSRGDSDPGAGVVAVKPGEALAVLRIPRFGKAWEPRVIIEGTTQANLRKGPGHYRGTALPGQIGNFSVAGHRATYGNGFQPMNKMRIGDAVVVETKQMWITYRVTQTKIVRPEENEVVAPVPGKPGVKATQRYITLTTCDPWYSARHRLIVHALFDVATPKSAGLPAALKG